MWNRSELEVGPKRIRSETEDNSSEPPAGPTSFLGPLGPFVASIGPHGPWAFASTLTQSTKTGSLGD